MTLWCLTRLINTIFLVIYEPYRALEGLAYRVSDFKVKIALQNWSQIYHLPRSLDTIFLVVYEPYRVLRGLQGVGFRGKECFTKMVSNFSEINSGFTYHEKINKK